MDFIVKKGASIVLTALAMIMILSSWLTLNDQRFVVTKMHHQPYGDERWFDSSSDIGEDLPVNTTNLPLLPTSEATVHAVGFRNQALRQIPMEMIEHMAPEIIKYIGRERLSNFKNPCWYEEDGGLYCFPYFYLLGITKCGTSDMYGKLVKHPEIISAVNKETHWWTQGRLGRTDPRVSIQGMLRRGAKFLDKPSASHQNSMNVFGDGSPSTFWDNHNWRTIFPNHTEGPPYVVADLIHSVNPEAKLIVTFREPVERMYSSYCFFGDTASAADFHRQVVARLEVFNQCRQTNSIRACTYQDYLNATPVYRMKPRMHIGMGIYYVYLEDWWSVYPREQLFITELKDWNQNCTSRLPQIFHFLGVASMSSSKIGSFCASTTRRNKSKHKKEPMWNTTRKLLQDFYRPFNKELFNMLQDPRFKWDYSS